MEKQGPDNRISRRGIPDRLLVPVLVAAILLLFVFFLKDIMIPYIRLELRHDVAGARELLLDKGVLGFLSVTLVEALQMVVVFIPAEFIQISSGLSYPFCIALLLCDLGVCLGASIIFVLVRFLHYNSAAFEKRRQKMDQISAALHRRNTILFMYLLFFMPIIPFGAICYFGSGTRLPYGKYIRTVATGVIPSIIVSNLIGEAGMAFLVRDLPLWLLVLVIVLLAAVLFAVIYFFLDRFCFRESDGTPDSPLYQLIFIIGRLMQGRGPRVVIHDERLQEADVPYVLLSNHQSFFDFMYIHQMAHPRNPAFVVNEYYCTRPVLRWLRRKTGQLSKKLFTKDLSSPMGIMRTARKGYPVVIFPEGRLSPDGRTNPIVEEGAAFYKKLGADLVLVKLRGAYFAGPKWRKRRFRSGNEVSVTVERVVKKDELRTMSDGELNRLIAEALRNDASEDAMGVYPRGHRAEGLENILYRCADCGALYTTAGIGDKLRCTACGREHTLDETYHFTDGPSTISAWYDRIRELERPGLDSVALRVPVRTVIYGANGGPARREEGECSLTAKEFSYRSENEDFTIPTDRLPALAYSCGKEFELYHNDELHYFYPLKQGIQAARWALIVDLLAERRREERE